MIRSIGKVVTTCVLASDMVLPLPRRQLSLLQVRYREEIGSSGVSHELCFFWDGLKRLVVGWMDDPKRGKGFPLRLFCVTEPCSPLLFAWGFMSNDGDKLPNIDL